MRMEFFHGAIRRLTLLVLASSALLMLTAAEGANCVPVPSGLLGWWAGEGNPADKVGLNPGVVQGNVVFQTGQVGQGFVFDGTNSFVQVPDSANLSPQSGEVGELTLEAWVRIERLPKYDTSTGSPYRSIVVKGSAGQWEYGFLINTNAEPRFMAWQLNGNAYGGTAGAALTLNQWHHLAGVLRKGLFVRFYVDGQLVSEVTSFSGDCSAGTSALYIGRRGDGQNLDGQVDEVSLYGRALSDGEIAGLFNAAAAGKCSTIAGAAVPYWSDFESGAGPEWMRRDVNASELLGFTRFSGQFQNNFQMLTLTNLVVGQSYTVGFDFYPFDSWDGGTSDYFEVRVNGISAFRYTFQNVASSQTYTGQPDEGRANYGFAPNWADSMYRNIEVTFVATNALTTIAFQGQNLESMDNESWGLDNVSVQLASVLTSTFVRSTTLPGNNTTNNLPIENFSISANWPLLGSTATNAANYSLREAGADGVLGNGDDVLFALTPSLPGAGGRSVAFAIGSAPLQAGHYRFQTTTGLQGTNGVALSAFTREFYVAPPVLGSLETVSNDTYQTPTLLPLTESPTGSGFFTAFASGTFSSTSDVDYWRFDAEAGDVITVRVESESQGVYPHLRLRNTSDQDRASNDGGATGVAQIQNFAITQPGTYLLRVWSSNNRSRYGMRVDLARGFQLESEDNSTQAAADPLAMSYTAGLSQGRIAGSLATGDSIDIYRIGVLNAGNAISVSTLYPTGSTLLAGSTVLGIQLDGNAVALVTNTGASLNYTVVSNGVHYVSVSTPNPNLRAQYLLNVTVSDGVPPLVTGTTLPDESASSSLIFDGFTVFFSEEMLPSSVTNSANYELRSAGADGLIGTADDSLYSLVSAGYSGGLSADFVIADGPLQPGKHRLTISQSLADRALNPMTAPFVRTFTIANVSGMVLENRNNDVQGFGTWLSPNPTGNADGTLGWINNLSAGTYVHDVTTGFVPGNTNLALVAANYGGAGTVTIYTNNGKAGFQVVTNVTVGGGPVSAYLVDLDNDGKADLVTANYDGNSVSVLMGVSGPGFVPLTNLSGFSRPYFLSVGDLNGDNKQDVVVPNSSSSSISVLLGNGNGSFNRSNYNVGTNPFKVAIGDINGDGRPDLVCANSGSSSLTLLTNDGSSGFKLAAEIPVYGNPRYVAIADVTGDSIPDLVALQNGDRTIAVLPGNGNGTFQPYRSYQCSAQDAYSMLLVDLNQDGKKDIVVPGYGNDQIAFLYNNGTGVFTNLLVYGTGQSPFAAVSGDFDGDGRPDVAISHYYGPYISLWLNNPFGALAEDPPASGLRMAVGRGALSDSSDVDYFRFSATAGDRAMVAVDVPGNPNSSSLNYQIRQLDGTVLASFNSDTRGWGQSGIITLPYTGTYVLRVARNHDYFGEYRIRVTLARPPVQLETENNSSLASANVPLLDRVSNHLKATIAGCLSYADGGDYFNLGNLAGGSTIKLDIREPSSSGAAEVISVYNAAGVLMTNSQAGAASLSFTVPTGADGVYYALLTPATGGFGSSSSVGVGFDADGELALGNWFNFQAFTISMWLYPGTSQTTYADIMDNNHRTGVSWVFQQDAGTQNHYSFGDGVAGIAFDLAPYQWQHLTVTRDTTNVLRLYLNGSLIGTAGGTAQITYNGSQYLRVGAWGGGGRNWRGIVDDLRIWTRALSQPEVAAGMSGTLTGNEADLAGYWPLNEGFGSTSADLSRSNHPAAFGGNAYWAFLGPTNAAPAGLLAQYLLDIDIASATPPAITGVSLPAEATTNSSLLSSFTLNFSEDMDPVFTGLSRNVLKYGGHSYFVTDSTGPWWTLESKAVALGGHLVAINDAAENNWLVQNFSQYSTLWIGGTDSGLEGTWKWTSGDPFTYSNWNGSEPNNGSGVEDYAQMYTGGTWNDASGSQALYGVIEVASSADQDGDGWVDVLDPYPADPLNAFDLRAAGPDGQFDTSDDQVYRITCNSYSKGLSAGFAIMDGPLQPGYYRFKVTTSLRDRFGVALAAPYIRYFTVAPVGGYVVENRRQTSGSSTTSLSPNPNGALDGSFSGFTTFGTPANPAFILAGNLNGDANIDLVTANHVADSITIWRGKGDGTFQATTNIATGDGAISAVLADFNKDGKPDLAIANYYANTVSILLGNGTGDFQVVTNIPGFSNPRNFAAADFNKDGKLDLAVANAGAPRVSVLFGNGDGTFQAMTNYPTAAGPQTAAAGDLNGDGVPDLAVATYNGRSVTVLLNTNGVFTATTNYPTSDVSRYVCLADLDKDGKLDVVALSDNGVVNVFPGVGDGTFGTRADYSIGGGSLYHAVVGDINGDGYPDIVAANFDYNRVTTLLGGPGGVLTSRIDYGISGNPMAVTLGDFNNDGRLDFASANYNGDTVSVFLGNASQLLGVDPAGTGLRVVAVRGNVADGNDLDYWTFSAAAGQRLLLTTENPGYPSGSSLLYRIYAPDWSQWLYFYTDGNGRAQGSWTVPASGTYRIRVEQNDAFSGEYRFRLTLADPPVQLETEDNGTLATADAVSLTLSNGQRLATMLGCIPSWDNGDFYSFGNLGVGTQIKLELAKPATSTLGARLELYKGSTLVTNSHPSLSNLVYVVDAGNEGAYSARVVGAYATHSPAVTNALLLDGGSAYVNLGGWSPGTNWSVQTWAMPSSLPSGRHLIMGSAADYRDWGLVLQDGKFAALIRVPGGAVTSLTAPESAVVGTWYHLAVTSDGTNAALYVNGVLKATNPVDLNYSPTTSGTWLGGAVCCTGQNFPGAMHDASIWKRALTQSEVVAFMATSPTGSEPNLAGAWSLKQVPGSTDVPDLSTNGHNGTLVNGAAYAGLAPLGSSASGLFQQYLLGVSLLDTIPPQVLSVSLPAEGAVVSNVVDRFSMVFSEDMTAAAVNAATNYDLRSAGPDNVFLTADDEVYTVVTAPAYVSGTSASYLVPDGPLQPGSYRFTVKTTVTDTGGTLMAAPYVRNFSVVNVTGFVFESRSNNSFATATSLSLNRTNRGNGSFVSGSTLGGFGSSVERIAAGYLDGGTNLDLVAALWNGSVAVLKGNGDGSFQVKTNYATGANAWSVALGKFDGDNNLDLAVANYGAHTVTVLTGNGDGTFQVRSNYAVGRNPYHVVAADLNKDGKTDLAIPSLGSGTVTVLLGAGDGAFGPAITNTVGASPVYIAVGDVNGDSKPDLAVANYGDNDVSLLLGNGDGTFAPASGIAAGMQPRAVALVDVNKDSKLDVVVFNGGDDTVSVMLGNGDGTFQPRVNYAAGTSDGYELKAADINLDGALDLVLAGYNNSVLSVLFNAGNGTFLSPATYGMGNRPVGLVVADLNNDGRLDIAAGNDSGQSISVLLGADSQPLTVDPTTGIRMAAGRGNVRGSIDVEADYWSFDAVAGDRLMIATESPGNPYGSSLLYRIYYPNRDQWTYFYSDAYGRGQVSLTVPVSGTYYIRAEFSDSYTGEYRLRVTLALPPVQLEAENNDDTGRANSLTYELASGHRLATVLGCINTGDPGDFFRLGVLSSNSSISLGLRKPSRSDFGNVLEIFDPSGSLATVSALGANQLNYTVPAGADGFYYARVRAVPGVLPAALPHSTGSSTTVQYDGNSSAEVLINVPEDAMTVSFWFRTLDPNAPLFSVMGGGGHDRHVYLSGGNMRTRIYNAGTASSSGLALADAAWHYLVFTYGSAIGGNKTYVDGVQVISDAKASSDFTWQDRIRFGYSDDDPTRMLAGQLDEARLWNRAFTPADVLQNMTNALTGAENGLLGYWRFNEGQGTGSLDRTTNAHNAVFINNPVWLPVNSGFSTPPGIFAQYLLDLDVRDITPPAIASISLPGAASTNASIIDRFSLGLSREVNQVINGLRRDIRSYGGHNYLLTDNTMFWYSAEQQARALGGHLVSVNDALENAWLATTFSPVGNLWLGFTDEAQKGNFLWASGEPTTYTNWFNSTPDYSGNKDYTYLRTDGKWANNTADTSYRGIMEFAGQDSDNDGLVDAIDTFPNDPYNVFDLRATGPDGLFDTPDDDVYHALAGNYTGGLNLDFSITDGPLQPGYYRFLVSSSLRDLFGNNMPAPFVRYFTVADVPGYVVEGRTNNSPTSTTTLPLTEDPPGLKTAAGRGNISSNAQRDYWAFDGNSNDWVKVAAYVPGSPAGSGLNYVVYKPDGTTVLFTWTSSYNGDGESPVYTLPAAGRYYLAVYYDYSYAGEYRFRLTVGSPPLQAESEDNGTIAAADPLTFATNASALSTSVAGRVRVPTDLDYYNLGTVSNGYSIFVNVRAPASSTFTPIVSVYNAAGAYQSEAPGGRTTDGVANVPITATGTYYAVVRSGDGTAGINEQYLMDVQVVPTGSVNFPNLVVSGVFPPSGSGILSGHQITYAFVVGNVGNVGTTAANWLDRAVLSKDLILGNGDDVPLGFLPHEGAVGQGASYGVTNLFTLPDGISGDYYLIVQTDAGNAINEYLFEGDNVTTSTAAFHVDVAPYPDLVVEGLNVAGPDANKVYTISWNTANRGAANAAAGFSERLLVRNQTSGALLISSETTSASSLAVGSVLPHVQTVVATNAGVYLVQVSTDSKNTVFEYSASGHAAAEANNTAGTNFQITAYYNVAVQSSPAGAGVVSGAGTYASGSPVTATATPNTNVLPYLFVNWTEGGSLQSASPNYSFLITRDRVLTANFTLPTFLIAATNLPPGAGTVGGQGTYFYGTTNVLSANANFGYRFTNWTENGVVVATTPLFTNVVTSNRFLVANYVEANTAHYVTTATSPTNIATVNGAGVYTNGQTAAISAPASITNPPNIYNFRQFKVNGSLAGSSRTINKTFSTLDPTNMQYVAFYDTISILPLITNMVVNPPGIVPATTNLLLSFQFNRSMDSNFIPVVVLTNASASVQPTVPAGGVWSSTVVSNDTFAAPAITLSNGMDGATLVYVSGARDLGGGQLARTNVLQLMVDVTPPVNPVLSLSASNNTTATVSWSGYAPPADLNGFRVYLSTNSFTNVAALTAISSLGSGARSFIYSGLVLDKPYYAAVAAVDGAGNSSPLVTNLAFTLTSAVPSPVPVQVAAAGPASATVSWQSYNTSGLLGFAGFRLYYERTNFSSVAALTPKQDLGPAVRTAGVDGLDRTATWYFAVVGYNGNGKFNTNVTTATWTDPYAGNISVNTTIGGSGISIVDILQSITVVNNAVVTIPAGTTLRFAPGTSLTVRGGTLRAEGTALDPIVLTSAADQPGSTPAAGDFGGVFLGIGAGNSSLKHVFINYGAGLTLSNCSPVVDAFTALNNAPAGLTVLDGGVLNTTNALLAYNGIGARQLGSGLLTVVQSSMKGNGTNAVALGGLTLRGLQDWWGSAVATEIDALLQGSVEKTGYLTGEPLLTPAIGTSNSVTQVGNQWVNLRLACRTADSMRLSEDSTFTSVFFTPFTNRTTFPLSAGGGQKTIFAQFRSLTSQTSAPVSVTVTYITAGPAISSFNLFEGEILTRPLRVTGAATAPLGMAAMEFSVDGNGLGTNAGGTLSQWFDLRTLSSDVHRVQLVARDNSGNVSVAAHNVTVIPTPPPAPFIYSPSADLVVSSNSVVISGSAEPFISVRLYRSGALAGTTNAAQDGSFGFAAVPLVEGPNEFTAVAVDPLGTASSSVRNVTLDTMPPAKLVMDTPTYTPGSGLLLTWHYPTSGKRSTAFQVFWSTAPISSIDQATGHTVMLSTMSTRVQGLATANYYFYGVGYDALGNASPLSDPVQYLYDAVPPALAVAYDKPSPVGASKVHVVISASKALAGVPTLTVQPFGATPALLPLTGTALNTYEADINITAQWDSGPVQLRLTAIDLAGNSFSGAPSGPPLVVDVTPPWAVIATAPLAPVQATNTTAVTVSLQLSEPPQAGTTPVLNFGPPVGAPVPVTLSGSGTNWLGSFNVTPAMGSGVGHFTFTASDSLGNVGHLISSGTDLEIYNTDLPSAPGQPVRFEAASLADGRVLLTWSNVPNAEIYRVYSEPGTNFLIVPTTMIADNIASNSYIDLPATDGFYRYVVTASRRGAEGTNSIVRVARSDRTGPPAPTNVVVRLVATGLQVSWDAGEGEQPYSYHVYRNGTQIRTTATATPIIDNPPRGIMSYTVAAVDALGNETLSAAVDFQLLVSAVNNLQALVDSGQAPQLTWTSPDPTAVGFNVYRNGIRQNTALLTAASFTDAFPPGASSVTYAVTAVNSTNAESAARSVMVYAADVDLLVNAAGGTSTGSPVTTYFDDYQVSVSNYTAGASLPLAQVEVLRQVQGQGSPLTLVTQANTDIGSGNAYELSRAVPSASVVAAQTVRVRALQQTAIEGSTVIYQKSFAFPTVQSSANTVEVSVDVPPLAGGLTDFNVKVYNRGFKPMYFVATRQNGAQPGDVWIAVRNPADQEVSRTEFNGVPSGVIFYGDVGYVMVPPGASTSLVVKDVLVPESLASNIVTFQAVVGAIYDRVSPAGQQRSGPLSGSMLSALSQTPYYGTAQTDYLLYSNSQPVVITGQALDRATGLPVPNVPLKLGFATRGYSWKSSVTTDANGNYTYIYNVQPGLAGSLMLWAAHPDIYDQLNQAQIQVYRIYVGPESGDIRMSKNDTMPFKVGLLNPGDVGLSGFTVSFQAYQMDGTNLVPISSIQGEGLLGSGFTLGPGERQQVSLKLIAAADAPTNAVGVFTIVSQQGAAATFTGYLTLSPAIPLITVIDPNVGYVETSLDRGALLSRQVTVVNRGLKDLLGVRILPPTNITWMAVNLPAAADGSIPLPDLLVGQSNTFTVVFTPPADTVLGFYQDKLTLRGTNAQSPFDVNLYARVTSANKGAVQFYVDNILGLDVPNATVRLRNTALSTELPPVYTDLNGLVTVTNLQEGEWSWQISAPGHSPNVGLANVIPAQTVNVSTRLNKSVVTVNFTVTPVPFTDRYEITIEQTFETHVPMPVLVLSPVHRHFEEVTPGFQASFIVTAKNEGLIQMTDVTFTGTQDSSGSFTPLITYLPALLPQQSVEIPFTFTYTGTNAPGRQGAGGAIASCSGMPNMDAIAGFIDGMNAFANAYAQCASDRQLIALAATVAVTYAVVTSIQKGAKAIAGALQGGLGLAKYLGCILGKLIGPIAGIGIPLAIQTAPPNQCVQQFVPIQAGCFAPGTGVLLADGTSRPIERLKPGDVLRSGNRGETATVVEVFERNDNTCRDLGFALPGQTEPGLLRTTDEHLFWEDGKGWVIAAELQPGRWLINEHGRRVQILSNLRVQGSHQVYTLKLRGDTAFYANGILVHDLCGVWNTPPDPAGAGSAPPSGKLAAKEASK